MKRIITYITLILFIAPGAKAQDVKCNDLVSNIEKLYRSGAYLKIVYARESIEKCKFSKAQKVLIYRYLIPSLYQLGFDTLSEQYTYKLLKLNPFYRFQPQSDPLALQMQLIKFYTLPKLTFSYSAGVQRTIVRRQVLYRLLDSADYQTPYSSRIAAITSFSMEFNWTKTLSTGLSLGFANLNYSHDVNMYRFLLVQYWEKSAFYYASLYQKIALQLKQSQMIVPFVKAGVYIGYSPKFYAELRLKVTNDSLYPDFIMPLRPEQFVYLPSNARRQVRYGINSALGLKINFQRFAFFAQLSYNHDLIDYVTEQGHYIPELMQGFYYVSDQMSLSAVSLVMGVAINTQYVVRKKYKSR